MAIVRFCGIEFVGNAGGNGFGLARLLGWYDAAQPKVDSRPRALADGNFGVTRFWRAARAITVEGSFAGSTVEEAYAAREVLAKMQADGLPSTFEVEDPLGIRSAEVKIVGGSKPDDGIFQPYFSFTFAGEASDHRKYGPINVTSTGLPASGGGIIYPILYPIDYGPPGDSGRLTIVNDGAETTFPSFEVTGGMTGGFEITDVRSGRVLRFDREVPLGSTVFLNLRTNRAYLDDPSNDVSGWLTRREWWAQPADTTSEVQFNSLGAVTGTPVLTARTASAF
jgi:hypothetical protein